MSLVSTEDRGAVRLIVYANAPFGTMTAAGAAEMFSAVEAAGKAASVRVIVDLLASAYRLPAARRRAKDRPVLFRFDVARPPAFILGRARGGLDRGTGWAYGGKRSFPR